MLLQKSKQIKVAGCQVGTVSGVIQLLKAAVPNGDLSNPGSVGRRVIVQKQHNLGQLSTTFLLDGFAQPDHQCGVILIVQVRKVLFELATIRL